MKIYSNIFLNEQYFHNVFKNLFYMKENKYFYIIKNDILIIYLPNSITYLIK